MPARFHRIIHQQAQVSSFETFYSNPESPMIVLLLKYIKKHPSSPWYSPNCRWKMLLQGRSSVYPVGILHHYIFIISPLWLTSHPRSTVVLLDTGTPSTSREIYSQDADGETQPRNPSVMMQYTNWINSLNSFPAIAIELFSSMAKALGL